MAEPFDHLGVVNGALGNASFSAASAMVMAGVKVSFATFTSGSEIGFPRFRFASFAPANANCSRLLCRRRMFSAITVSIGSMPGGAKVTGSVHTVGNAFGPAWRPGRFAWTICLAPVGRSTWRGRMIYMVPADHMTASIDHDEAGRSTWCRPRRRQDDLQAGRSTYPLRSRHHGMGSPRPAGLAIPC